jgi:aldehyde dehydrogenase (NAD+)
MKPSELTPLTALVRAPPPRLARADPRCAETVRARCRSRVRPNTVKIDNPTDQPAHSFPPGVLNTVPSLGSVGGAALAAHPDVDKVAFTGSTLTGRKIMAAAAASNLKKVSLELGGKSPHLVFDSADLDQAANWAALGIMYNTGQDCTAGSRVYVQAGVYDKFVALLVQKAKELRIGDGFDDANGGGPVVSKTQYDRVWGFIEAGKKAGATPVVGGTKRAGKGFYVDPVIFTDITPDMQIVRRPRLPRRFIPG